MTESHPHLPPNGRPDAPAGHVDVLIIELAELRPTYPVRTLLGRRVCNDVDEAIGALDDLMIDENRVAFAILSVGGFLGLGVHKVVVDFERLIVDDDEIVLPGATREALKQMTVYDAERVSREHIPRRHSRRRAHEITTTAAGEPIPATVADVTDDRV